MSKRHITIIDDHAMFRAGLRMLINANMPELMVSEAGSLSEATQKGAPSPDVVLLDIQLPGLNGMEGIALLQRRWPEVPVVMLSSQDDPDTAVEAVSRGASCFVSKAETAERIVQTLARLLNGETLSPPTEERVDPSSLRLTPRQCEVLELLCQGLSNKLIARRLEVSENTVRWHVQAILEALGVSSRAEAAFAARTLGLIG